MRIVCYGEGDLTYDISACCGHCGARHVARYPVGTRLNARAACPDCGVGGTVVYGSRPVAVRWLQEPSRPRCVRCGRAVPLRTDAFCDGCWKHLFLQAVVRTDPAVSPCAALFAGLPPVPPGDGETGPSPEETPGAEDPPGAEDTPRRAMKRRPSPPRDGGGGA